MSRSRRLVWVALLLPSVFVSAEHARPGGKPRAEVPVTDVLAGVSRVVEKDAGSAGYRGELLGLSELPAESRVRQLRAVLRGTEWVCRGGKLERGVEAVDELLSKHPQWRQELESERERSADADLELMVEYLTSAGALKSVSRVLSLSRAVGTPGSLPQRKFLRALTADGSWLPKGTEAVLSYLAESALQGASDSDFSAETKTKLKALVKEPHLSQRRTALLRLAASEDEGDRELYRQLVFTLPRAVLSEVLPDSDACALLRFGGKLKSLLPLAGERELSGAIVKRVLGEREPGVELSDLFAAHPELHEAAVPHLLAMEGRKDKRAAELVNKLSPEAKQLIKTMRPHLAGTEVVKGPLPSLPASAPGANRGDRPKPPKTLAELGQLLREPGWYCGKWGWDSNLAIGHAALEGDAELRKEFVKANDALAAIELKHIIEAWRAGGMRTPELVARLEQHSDRYWVTESAKHAREIVIGLETNLELKTYLQEEHQRVATGVQGKAVITPGLVVTLGARAQNLLLRMPTAARDKLVEEAGDEASCLLPVFAERVKAGDALALELRERLGPIEPLLSFVRIEPGEFWMGTEGNKMDEIFHQVKINKPFELQQTEVTQALYQRLMKKNPSTTKGASLPVTDVSYVDAKEFIQALNEHASNQTESGKQKYYYRLPSEAEWEYAARGGHKAPKKNTVYGHGDDEKALSEYAWFNTTQVNQVGTKKPNTLGLFDMHGNVLEWVEDAHVDDVSKVAVDEKYGHPVNHTGSDRVIRGGSWGLDARPLRSAYRSYNGPGGRLDYLGFRLERTPIP